MGRWVLLIAILHAPRRLGLLTDFNTRKRIIMTARLLDTQKHALGGFYN